MNPPTPWDLVAIFALIGGAIFGNPAVSTAIAPYAASFFAALVGTMWSLSRMEADSRKHGFLFVLKIVGAAMIVTVPLAVYVAPKLGLGQYQYAVAPIAFLIGAVGNDWKPFINTLLDFFTRWKSAGNRGSEDNDR